jgi:hypothetical protein
MTLLHTIWFHLEYVTFVTPPFKFNNHLLANVCARITKIVETDSVVESLHKCSKFSDLQAHRLNVLLNIGRPATLK